MTACVRHLSSLHSVDRVACGLVSGTVEHLRAAAQRAVTGRNAHRACILIYIGNRRIAHTGTYSDTVINSTLI